MKKRIYVIPDIHGCLSELQRVVSLIEEELYKENTKLVFLGDYIHGGEDSKGVIEYIMELENKYGSDKVIPLLGNHEEFVLEGVSAIESIQMHSTDKVEDKYIDWIKSLPRFYQGGNTIFVHAGIDHDLGSNWKYTDDYTFTNKYPAYTGQVEGLEYKVVAGHVSTSEIAEDETFHGIYYDGYKHYYLDGDVLNSGKLNLMLVITGNENDTYYEVTERGEILINKYWK